MLDKIAPLFVLLLPLACCLVADLAGGWLARRRRAADVKAENESWFRCNYQRGVR